MLLDSTKLEPEIKLEILYACFNYQNMLFTLIDAIKTVAVEIEPMITEFNSLVEETINDYEKHQDCFYDYVKESTGLVIATNNYDEVFVYPSILLRGFSIDISNKNPASITIIIEFRMAAITKMSELLKSLSGINALRALVEKTKLEIISAIAKKPMYGSEIAELLGLTGATVSHHVNELLRYSLIAVDVQKRRAYYSPNRSGIKKAVEAIN